MRDDGELLEHAIVYGQHKGVPKAPVREALGRGQDVLMRTDIQGAHTIKSLLPGAITIFVLAPNDAELVRRLQKRASETTEELATRLRVAEEEIAAAEGFDFTIVNDDLDRCAAEVEEILARERCEASATPYAFEPVRLTISAPLVKLPSTTEHSDRRGTGLVARECEA